MEQQALAAVLALALAVLAPVQGGRAAEPSAKPEEPAAIRYQRGMAIKAEGGGFKNIVGTLTVPMDWPDQQYVQVLKEELPPGATATYKTVAGVGRQMALKVPFLAAGQEARAVVTFEVRALLPAPVPEPAALRLPAAAALDRKMSPYLAPGPFCESDHAEVRKTSEEIAGAVAGAWEKVVAIHGWVKKNVKHDAKAGKEQGALRTLRTRTGEGADKNSLAVALCRAQGIPARLVLIARPGHSDHCYFEFYLTDAKGAGHWLAADQAVEAAPRPAGAARAVLLQKGDNVATIDPKTARPVQHRFLADSLRGLPQARGAQLQLQVINRPAP